MDEVSVNIIRIIVLAESGKWLVRQNAGLPDFILKFPGKGRLMPGRPIEKRRIRGGRLDPVLHWVASTPRPLQQVERECADRDSLTGGSGEWQLADSNPKLRILIVCDVAEQLQELQTALGACQVELFTAASIDELRNIHDSVQFDLAVVDVNPNLIVIALSLLRGNSACGEATILVESRQVTGNLALAGVLPSFRAMPCSRNDLLRLVCGRVAPESLQPSLKRTLF